MNQIPERITGKRVTEKMLKITKDALEIDYEEK